LAAAGAIIADITADRADRPNLVKIRGDALASDRQLSLSHQAFTFARGTLWTTGFDHFEQQIGAGSGDLAVDGGQIRVAGIDSSPALVALGFGLLAAAVIFARDGPGERNLFHQRSSS
jgi:hypothetical protein